MKITVILITLYNISTLCFAQNFQQRYGSVPFSINSEIALNPFNGGIDMPRFQFVNIDGDGDLDLFMFDRDTTLNFYRNDGNASSPSFILLTQKYLNLPVKNWFWFADIDADNDFDLFSGGDFQTIRFFRNTGSSSNPVFTLEISELKTNTDSTIYAESVSNPNFADINADGDLDLFLGTTAGRITYYENIGNQQNFSYRFITSFYAGIEILGGGDYNRHGASSILFNDIDADNDPDLYWGDYFGESIYYIKNTGSPQNFNWNIIDTTSPEPNPWYSTGFNMPRINDIDNDGKKDFFIGVIIGSQSKNNFVHYKNIGPVNNPQFTKMTENFIPCVDIGSNSYPSFTDIDNDNDPDLFIGSDHSTIAFYKNTGTPLAASYNLVTDSLPIIKTSFYYAPSFSDMNGDGKKDMLLGAYDGKLRYFINTGSLTNPVFSLQSLQMIDTIDVGQSSAPFLTDIDNDNDFDLFVGNSNGRIFFYRNDGSSGNFLISFVTNFFQNISAGNDSSPCFGDLDFDDDLDLIVGNRTGKLFFYRNTGSVTSPVFNLVTSNYANVNVSYYSVPALADIDSDTDRELFVGNIKGGIYFYLNLDVNGVNPVSTEIPFEYKLYQNYPNPFNSTSKIKFNIPSVKGNVYLKKQIVRLVIYNSLGKIVMVLFEGFLEPGVYESEFEGSKFASGVYFYSLIAGNFQMTRKLVLIK